MKHVIDVDRVSTVDYLSGDDPYKKDWMSHRQERWALVGYNRRTVRGNLHYAFHRFRAKWKTLVQTDQANRFAFDSPEVGQTPLGKV